MKQTIRTLICEDNPEDAELVVRRADRAGFALDWHRIDTEQDFLAALQAPPELILSDYSMPGFSGLRALELLRDRGLDVPFILISGALGEQAAVDAMKLGATDYLMKEHTARLGHAIERALAEKRLRDERRHAARISSRNRPRRSS